jgi:peptide/nickel transport system substrate-binding protein
MRTGSRTYGLVAVILLVTACSTGTTSSGATYPSSLKIALSTTLQSFDPRVAQPLAKLHLDLMYDHLVGTNADETAVSKNTGIASNWSTTDNTTWQFTLRNNFHFSNGQPLTADDVQFSLQRLLQPQATAAYATYFKSEKLQVTVQSPTALTIVLATPSFALPLYLSSIMGNEGDVIPKAYVQQNGDAYFNLHPIGSGPYILASVTTGVSIVYQATGKPHPILGTPRYKTVEFDQVVSDPTRVAQLQTGGADMIDIGDFSELQQLTGSTYRIEQKPGSNIIGIGLAEQWKNTPNSNQDFREALSLAINVGDINTALFGGRGKLTGVYPVGPQAIGFKDINPYPYDPAQAKTLLKSSNYNGAAIDLYAWPQSGLPGAQRVTEAIQQDWAAIGVNVNLITTDQATYIGKWVSYKLNFAASAVAIANRPLGLSVYQGQFYSTGSSTYTHDPNIDSLVQQLVAAQSDTQATGALTQQVDQYIHDHYLTIPLIQLGSFYAVKSASIPQWSLGGGQYDINVRAMVSGS